MFKVIFGKMVHTPGKIRVYADTHIKQDFNSWEEANEWRINQPQFFQDKVYSLIVEYHD